MGGGNTQDMYPFSYNGVEWLVSKGAIFHFYDSVRKGTRLWTCGYFSVSSLWGDQMFMKKFLDQIAIRINGSQQKTELNTLHSDKRTNRRLENPAILMVFSRKKRELFHGESLIYIYIYRISMKTSYEIMSQQMTCRHSVCSKSTKWVPTSHK